MVEITDEMIWKARAAFLKADKGTLEIDKYALNDWHTWNAALSAVLPDAIAQARKDALEEAAKIADDCDGPLACPTFAEDECFDMMAKRISAAIRAEGGEK